MSYKHSEKVLTKKLAMKWWFPLNTIEGIKIMMISVIELSTKCQMKDWIYYLMAPSKSRRFVGHMFWKSTKKELQVFKL